AVIRHRAPRMILRWRLRIPYVAGISSELTILQGTDDGVAVADLSAGGIHDVCTVLHPGEQVGVEHALGTGMKGRIYRNDVTDPDHVLDIRVEGEAKLLLDRLGKATALEIVQLHFEGLEPA